MVGEDGPGLRKKCVADLLNQNHLLHLGQGGVELGFDELLSGEVGGRTVRALAQQADMQDAAIKVQYLYVAAVKGQLRPDLFIEDGFNSFQHN